RAFVNNCIFHNGQRPRASHNCAIVLRATGKVIGWIGFGHPSQLNIGDYDFGYALHRAYWGQGCMTEALRALLAFCFDELGARSVFGECYAANPASARVMEKAGMRCLGYAPSKDVTLGPGLRYILQAEDWRRAHAAFA